MARTREGRDFGTRAPGDQGTYHALNEFAALFRRRAHDISPLTHFDAQGQAHMVDVSAKADAPHRGRGRRDPHAARHLRADRQRQRQEGRRAGHRPHRRHPGRQALQRAGAALPPAAHHAYRGGLELDAASSRVLCRAQVETLGRTGVEMEALCAVQVGLLTIYDMCRPPTAGWSSVRCACWRSTAASRVTGRRSRRSAQGPPIDHAAGRLAGEGRCAGAIFAFGASHSSPIGLRNSRSRSTR